MFLAVLITLCALTGGHVVSSASSAGTCTASYEKEDCYEDSWAMRKTEKLKLKLSFRNQINWEDPISYKKLIADLVCQCAQEAMENNYGYFAIQYWGECWIGDIKNFIEEGKGGWCNMPTDLKFVNPCDKNSDDLCIGANWSNYVYRLTSNSPPPACVDLDPNCPKYEAYCDKPNYDVKNKCPLTCNNCP